MIKLQISWYLDPGRSVQLPRQATGEEICQVFDKLAEGKGHRVKNGLSEGSKNGTPQMAGLSFCPSILSNIKQLLL